MRSLEFIDVSTNGAFTYRPRDIVVSGGIRLQNDNSDSMKGRMVALIRKRGKEWLVVPISSKLGSHTGEQLPSSRLTGLREQSILSPLNVQTVHEKAFRERLGKVPFPVYERLLDSLEHLL